MADFYDQHFRQQLAAGVPRHSAVEETTSIYLDGKPKLRGKHKITSAERDTDFWSSVFLRELPSDFWKSDPMPSALARYFAQERVANVDLLTRIAKDLPETLCNAVRHSGLVLRQHYPRRADLDQIAGTHPEGAELCKVLDIFELAHRERLAALEHAKTPLMALTPFDLLVHSSLYVFEHILPHSHTPSPRPDGAASADEIAWDAINDILLWKLATAPESTLKLHEADIGRSLGEHLTPLLSPSSAAQSPVACEVRAAFAVLLEAQIERHADAGTSHGTALPGDEAKHPALGAVRCSASKDNQAAQTHGTSTSHDGRCHGKRCATGTVHRSGHEPEHVGPQCPRHSQPPELDRERHGGCAPVLLRR